MSLSVLLNGDDLEHLLGQRQLGLRWNDRVRVRVPTRHNAKLLRRTFGRDTLLAAVRLFRFGKPPDGLPKNGLLTQKSDGRGRIRRTFVFFRRVFLDGVYGVSL